MTTVQQRGAGRGGRGTTIVIAVLVFLVVVAGLVAGGLFLQPDLLGGDDAADDPGLESSQETVAAGNAADAEVALVDFVAALENGDLTSVSYARSAVGLVASDFASLTDGIAPFTITAEPGPVNVVGPAQANAPIQLTWDLAPDLAWVTESDVDLELIDGEWLVRWDPAILEPSLSVGDVMDRTRTAPGRAQILARNGEVLVGESAVVVVGIQPSRVDDLPSLVLRLQELVGSDPAELTERVTAANPDAFVEVTVLPRPVYDTIREEIFPLPGTVFREETRPAVIDGTFARALLGRSGEVTAEIIEEFPGIYVPGDYVGLSGLQATYNAELSGRPGITIMVTRAAPDPNSTTTGTGLITTSSVRDVGQPEVLVAIEPVVPDPVTLTIEPGIQRAAEAALAASPLTSALVAVEVSSGDVVAVANGPTGATVNFAMTGQYPPGSIFKVISGYALLRDRLDQTDPVDCPVTITVDGRSFANAEDEVLGIVPFRDAFAHSCNTAFVGATLGYDFNVLANAAAGFGLGTGYDVGEPVFSGSVPVADSTVDLAASAFGQGRVLMSPFSAAVMAATAADGVYRSPVLVSSPNRAIQAIEPLDRAAAATLRELMRAVVTEGTGRAVAGVDGPPVSGKTGTAEFGNEDPPRSHAWFVGYQGDIAFAVFVEAGEFGGSTAAPIAATFLNALAQGSTIPVAPSTTEAPPTTVVTETSPTTEG